MRSAVEGVIYFYIFICIALLVFNVVYIMRDTFVERRRGERIVWWKNKLTGAGCLSGSQPVPENLYNRLCRIEHLMAFHAVVTEDVLPDADRTEAFFRTNLGMLRRLALEYGRKTAMERAYYAYVIASFHSPLETPHDNLSEILLRYIDDSTVYCRENVLNAFYALGSEQALEQALAALNENGYYHNPKLISDGMARFTGDKISLVRRLWRHRYDWEECLVVGLVQFATGIKGDTFDADFLAELESGELSEEIRFALVRYFRRHHYETAAEVLIRLLRHDETGEDNLAIAAAASLVSYPGGDTKEALKKAVTSRNWYVRRNAAGSLAEIGITDKDLEDIRSSHDRYAEEMIGYMLGEKEEGK